MTWYEIILNHNFIFNFCPDPHLNPFLKPPYVNLSFASFVVKQLSFLINRFASIIKTKIKINLLNELQKATASVGTFSLQKLK